MTQDIQWESNNVKTLSERVWGKPTLDTMRGFLPLKAPYTLGSDFDELNVLLTNMPVIKKDGTPGLLAENQFRIQSKKLVDYAPIFNEWYEMLSDQALSENEKDSIAMDLAVAFRDYQYLKMGYLFESVHQGDGAASEVLPKNIANSLVFLANIFQHKPWLEYASGYVLMNSEFNQDITADKVSLIRQWHGGPDEFYFQTVHSIIEWETPQLFKAIASLIRAIENNNEDILIMAMEQGIATSQLILDRLKQMPQLSRPAYYAADVRPQIQGLVGNCGEGKLFSEKGVRYESDFFPEGHSGFLNDIRGQTGAQSSIIPLLDNILGVTDFYAAGDNPLTKMLRAFRHYRPKPHTQLLEFVESEQARLNIRQVLKKREPLLLARWTGIICQFREFHFYLAMAYIVKPGKASPIAQSRAIGTGGSPTPKYLPQHVSESLYALKEALQQVEVASLSSVDQLFYQFWCDYVQKTESANMERSKTVADYLVNEKLEAKLDQTIQSTVDKIQRDTTGSDRAPA